MLQSLQLSPSRKPVVLEVTLYDNLLTGYHEDKSNTFGGGFIGGMTLLSLHLFPLTKLATHLIHQG